MTVKNFMSVGNDTQAINFNRTDLTLVLGENLDMGGDDQGARNGTGKTTIVNALSYVLYGQALTNIKRDNLINNTNCKNMLVTLTYSLFGKKYRIERGRKPALLKYYIDDKEVDDESESQGENPKTQDTITKSLVLTHTMFKYIVALNTYTIPFLATPAAAQREIIEQLMGITLLSEKAIELKKEIKTTKDSIMEEKYRIKGVESANEKILKQIASLKRREQLWVRKHKEAMKKDNTEIDKLMKIDIEWELLQHEGVPIWKDIQFLLRLRKNNSVRIVSIEKEKISLQSKKCYVCGQNIDDKKIQNTLDDLKIEKADLERQNTDIESENIKMAKPITHYPTIKEAYEHKNAIVNLVENLAKRKEEIDPYSEQISEMESESIQEVNFDHLAVMSSTLDHEEFLLKLLTNKDSFIRKRIIDQNLSLLNSRLEYYLEKMGLPHQIIFKNDLSVEITQLGRDLDFDNLSRGERNRLILGLSWAFRDVWENLYHSINLLFVDELIDSGMDTNGVEGALKVLKSISRERNKSVWLVSHKDDFIGRVNNVLMVTKENDFTSYAVEHEIV